MVLGECSTIIQVILCHQVLLIGKTANFNAFCCNLLCFMWADLLVFVYVQSQHTSIGCEKFIYFLRTPCGLDAVFFSIIMKNKHEFVAFCYFNYSIFTNSCGNINVMVRCLYNWYFVPFNGIYMDVEVKRGEN